MTDLYAEGRCIARGLIGASFPVSALHHREHCLATASLLLEQPGTDWSRELPRIIRRYNLAVGGANTDQTGYHETLTQFFLGEIRDFLAAHATLGPEAACLALLASPLAVKEYPLRYYSRARLYSRAARLAYLAPDLRPVADARFVT